MLVSQTVVTVQAGSAHQQFRFRPYLLECTLVHCIFVRPYSRIYSPLQVWWRALMTAADSSMMVDTQACDAREAAYGRLCTVRTDDGCRTPTQPLGVRLVVPDQRASYGDKRERDICVHYLILCNSERATT